MTQLGHLVDATLDYWLWQAEREIEANFGQQVSVAKKGKSLNKFGRTMNADDGVKTTVATFQGAVVEELFVTTNLIDAVGSDDAGDTETLVIEGHTIDGEGALTFVVQEVLLAGLTPAVLATPLARCTRMFVKAGTFGAPAADLVGNVYAYDDTDGETAGVPNTPAATKCMIVAGQNQSAKCATSISDNDYWIITSVQTGIERGSGAGARADLCIECRLRGGVWLPLGLEIDLDETSENFVHVPMAPYHIIPPNSDVRLVAISDSANTQVGGSINGVLAIVES